MVMKYVMRPIRSMHFPVEIQFASAFLPFTPDAQRSTNRQNQLVIGAGWPSESLTGWLVDDWLQKAAPASRPVIRSRPAETPDYSKCGR